MPKKQESLLAKKQIQGFMHCANCMSRKPDGISPAEWAKLECGWTQQGFQVWCRRCDVNVVHVNFEGQQHPANTRMRDDS